MHRDDELTTAMRRWTIENTRFDHAVARRYGIGAADMHALEELEFGGGLTPGRLGERLQLTSGSVTALADRLERQGLVERVAHPTDRRTSVLRLTARAESFAREAYEPFGAEMRALGGGLSAAARAELVAFFEAAAAVAARHAAAQGAACAAAVSRAARRAPPAS